MTTIAEDLAGVARSETGADIPVRLRAWDGSETGRAWDGSETGRAWDGSVTGRAWAAARPAADGSETGPEAAPIVVIADRMV